MYGTMLACLIRAWFRWTFVYLFFLDTPQVVGLAVSYIIVLVEFRHLAEVLHVTTRISEQLQNATALAAESSH